MTELEETIKLANWYLDRPNADPDDHLLVLSRQFLRQRELVHKYKRMARNVGKAVPCGDFERASGEAVCDKCQLVLFDHPICADPVGQLVVACDGKLYKL